MRIGMPTCLRRLTGVPPYMDAALFLCANGNLNSSWVWPAFGANPRGQSPQLR